MSQTKAQLVGGVGFSTADSLTVHNGLAVTGVVTATSFAGNITGDATGLTGSPNIDVTNITASGNVTIGGTLTYEDVTNIDAIGIVTARSGINITGAGMTVTGISTFRGDVQVADKIVHLDDSNTAIRFPAADTFSVETAGSERLLVDSSGNIDIGNNDGSSSNTGWYIQPDGTAYVFTDGSTDAVKIFAGQNDERITLKGDGELVISDKITHMGDTNTAIRFPAADTFTVETGGSERIRVDSSGNLGIGTASPGHLLTLKGTQAFEATNSTNDWLAYTYTDNTFRLNYNGAGADEVVIDSSGNVGIGTVAPASNLHVVGNNIVQYVEATGTAAEICFRNNTSTGDNIRIGGSGNNLTFDTGGSESARIDSSGRLGIGTASVNANLQVHNSSANATLAINNGTVGPALTDGLTLISATDGSAFIAQRENADLIISTNNTERARIDSSGRLLLGTNSVSYHTTAVFEGNSGSATNQGQIYINRGETSVTSGEILGIIRFGATGDLRGADIRGVGDGTWATDDYPTSLQFLTTSDGGNSPTERVRITSAGRMGVGTNDPSTNLHVVGGIRATTAFDLRDTSGNKVLFVEDASNDARISNETAGEDIIIRTTPSGGSATERLRITSGGVITAKNGAVAEIDTLTSATTVTPDFAASCNFTLTLGHNVTLANPSNLTAGQSGSIFLIQDGTGSRTITFGSNYDFAGGTAPTLSTAASSVDRLDYIVRTSSSIHCVVTLAYS